MPLRVALGTILARQGDPEGRWVLEELLERQPLTAQTHYTVYLNLGFIRKNQGYLDEAIELYRMAAEAPQGMSLELRNNLGIALALRGRAEGIAMLEKLVRNNPLSALAHFNLGIALLVNGRYETGWAEFNWWRKVDQLKKDARPVSAPAWAGELLHGRTILLYAEQGFGDTLQFLRYLPMVVERGGRVVLEVQPQLHRLLRDLPGVAECVSIGQTLPAHDVAASLMSLPRTFRTTLQTIPPPLKLSVPSTMVREDRYKVGLVWAGNPKHTMDRLRSVPLVNFGVLAKVQDVAFTSLQAGAAAAHADEPGQRIVFAADCSGVKDFANTAAIIAGLDLVITVDSAVAHLAGSMGKPVWMLVANIPDWRWGISSLRTDWYPTMRLFRQGAPGDWLAVMEEIRLELAEEVRKHMETGYPELLRA